MLYQKSFAMKKLATILAMVLPLYQVLAQTFLTQDFGSSKEAVLEFLGSKSGVAVSQFEDNKVIASSPNYTVAYFFNEGNLYQMETTSHADSKKEAEEKFKAMHNNCQSARADLLDIERSKEATRFAALKDRQLTEVMLFDLGKNGYQLKVSTTDLDKMPDSGSSRVQREEMLFSMVR